MINQETKDILENGHLWELDELIFEIKEAINQREDIPEVIELLQVNGITLDQTKICKKKRPS